MSDIIRETKARNIDANTLANSAEFKEKIYKELESNGMSYSLMNDLVDILGIDNCVESLDIDRIGNSLNGTSNIYYTVMLQKDPDKLMNKIMSDDKNMDSFMNGLDKNYSILSNCNSNKLMEIVQRANASNKDVKNINYVLSYLSDEDKKVILNGDFKQQYVHLVINSSSNEIVQDFINNSPKALTMYKDLDIIRLAEKGISFPSDIVKRKDFFEELKASNMVDFRRNINIINRKSYHPALAKRVEDYERNILDSFNTKTRLIGAYDLDNLEEIEKQMDGNDDYIYDPQARIQINEYKAMVEKYKEMCSRVDRTLKEKMNLNLTHEDLADLDIGSVTDDVEAKQMLEQMTLLLDKDHNKYNWKKETIENKLREMSNAKMGEVLADYSFEDTLKNVQINAKEMLRFNSHLDENEQLLSEDNKELYNNMINMENLTASEKYELYKSMPDKEAVRSGMYKDFKALRDKSYDMINNSLYKTDKSLEDLQEEQSLEEQAEIYKLSGKPFYMLVRAMESPYHEHSSNTHSCYSLISGENTKTYNEGGSGFLYGYDKLDKDKVENVFESDSYTLSTTENITNRTNRLMTPEEIVTSSDSFSEINIKNDEYIDENGKKKYKEMKPNYLVTKAEPTKEEIDEAKRLGIPLVWVEREKYQDKRMDEVEYTEYDYDIN